MGIQTDARAGVERNVDTRPWTVKLYVALVAASQLLLLLPPFAVEYEWSSLVHLLLLLGVWVGSRMAWALALALYSFSCVIGVVWGTGPSLVLVGLLVVCIGLLLTGPTQQWVGRRGAVRALVAGLPSEWQERPWTLRTYVGASLAVSFLSVAAELEQLAFPQILFAVLSLLLLKMLWDGSAGVWWWSVIAHSLHLVVSLLADGPRGALWWCSFVAAAVALALLVHPSTRRWFNGRIAERYP